MEAIGEVVRTLVNRLQLRFSPRVRKAAGRARDTRDFDRPLVKKGQKQIARVSAVTRNMQQAVDHVVSSPALRAQQTAERFVHAIKFNGEIAYDERIYEASVNALLTVLREQPEVARHVVLIGHNPGLQDLVSALVCGDEGRLNLKLSTAGLAYFHMEIARWQQVRLGSGVLRLLTASRFQKKG